MKTQNTKQQITSVLVAAIMGSVAIAMVCALLWQVYQYTLLS
jgi:hypothetical protein